ncbi:MAG: efflux RND transporter periplasmic adaptor subunit [Candidatus Paceibacterota bacterium]
MKIKKILKNKYSIIVAVILVIIIAGFFLFNKKDSGVTYIKAERKDITQSVLASGKTKAVDSVDLGFEKSGKVAVALVDVGSRVVAGQTLVELDSSELQADLLKAKADLAEENANGAADSVAISDAIANARAVMLDSFTKADNVIRESVDQFFENPNSIDANFRPSMHNGNSVFYFTINFSTKVSINKNRSKISKVLSEWKTEIDSLSQDNTDALIAKSKEHLQEVKTFVDEVSLAIFEITPSDSDSVAVISDYKSDMSTARTTINTVLSNMISAQEKINSARASETQTGSDSVSAQNARKLQIEANIQNIQSQIAKTRITAPFDGVVTKQDVEKGEIVSAGSAIVSVISDNKLEIESNVSEVNIGKISVGNPVSITLDAYPGQTFSGTVSYIDPGETIVDGVVNYKVKIAFNTGSSLVKSGLTANLDIETAKKTSILSVPLFVVTKKGDKNFVKKMVDGEKAQEVEVVLGIVSQDGEVEVISGLSDGDTIEVGSQ